MKNENRNPKDDEHLRAATDIVIIDDFVNVTARLVEMCNQNSIKTKSSEEKRLWSLAATHYEEASMRAIKAATNSARD